MADNSRGSFSSHHRVEDYRLRTAPAKQTHRHGRAGWWAVIPLSAAFMTACSHPQRTLGVGYIPISECLPLYVAIEQGFFQDEGLTVTLQSMAGGAPILQALSSGSVDVGFSNVVSLVLQRANGADFYPIYGASYETEASQNHALLGRAGTKAALGAGSRIGVNTTRNIEELMVRRYLRSRSIDPQTIDFRAVGFPQMMPALANGGLDAVSIVEPFISIAKSDSTIRTIANHYLAIGPRILVATYVTSAIVSKAKARELQEFVRAMTKAASFIREHPAEARRALSNYTRLPAAIIPLIGLPEFADTPKRVDFAAIADLMIAEGFIDSAGLKRAGLAAMHLPNDQ